LYRDIKINAECLQQLEENPVLPFNIEHVRETSANAAATSRYDSSPEPDTFAKPRDGAVPLPSIIITDVDCHASSNELRATALRHVKKSEGGYIQIPHDCEPENEFRRDSLLFPLVYPTLFPYGIGGPNDSKRDVPRSLKHHVKHLLSLSDSRFQEHPSFSFTAFNILQRHETLLHASLKVNRQTW
jgi:hypothetical protein